VKEVNTMVKGTIDVEWEVAIRKAFGLPDGAPVVDVEEVPGNAERGARNAELQRPSEGGDTKKEDE
jgi:hypothetical protein